MTNTTPCYGTQDAEVRNCVVGTNCYIARGCTVQDTVLLGNSQYQSCSYRDEERAAGRPVQVWVDAWLDTGTCMHCVYKTHIQYVKYTIMDTSM